MLVMTTMTLHLLPFTEQPLNDCKTTPNMLSKDIGNIFLNEWSEGSIHFAVPVILDF